METKPLVTVCLISMNHEKYIEQACKSIINQTYSNIEVVFLDNNSTDKTFEKAFNSFKNSNIPFYYIKNDKNKGVSENLNIQVQKANGDYISILSGDDWYEANDIEKRLNFLIENNLDVVYANGYKYIEESKERLEIYTKRQLKHINNIINSCYENNLVNNSIFSPGFFTKKQILLKNPFDVNIHAEDWDINLRLSKLGYQFGFINEHLFNYRVLSSSLSNNFQKMEDSYKQITNKYLKEISQNPIISKKYKIQLISFEISKLKEKDFFLNKQEQIANYYYEINQIKYKNPKKMYKNSIIFLKKITKKL